MTVWNKVHKLENTCVCYQKTDCGHVNLHELMTITSKCVVLKTNVTRTNKGNPLLEE